MGFQQGLSGLSASSKSLEVIGNNIANSETYGAKSSRTEFADAYASAIGGSKTSVGIGVSVAAVAQQFSQGNITATDNPYDLAINGSGFFQFKDTDGGISYSRDGELKVDRTGLVVNNQGQQLLGYPVDASGNIVPGIAGPLQIPTAGVLPSTTSSINLEANFDSRSAVTAPTSGVPINFADPTTYNNATSQNVYDAKGQEVALTYYFQKAATDTWNVFVTANGTPISTSGGNPVASTTISYTSNGAKPSSPTTPISIDIPAVTNAAGATSVAISGVQLDVSATSQYGSQFAVTDLKQNGYAAGSLIGVQFQSNGILTASYSNGQTQPAGQIEIASFRNPQGLTPTGGNGWVATYASGEPVTGVPGAGNLGVLQASALEESNVDLTAQLVDMITAQRIYQANAQTIKTQDQVLQTIVNLR